ncbi:putative Ypt/Rab-type GTPase YPT7 [Blattamonas nauphoetae]|uniref:Ypt/Rab-type GTPase YPT7 n=1 Tax=Blattamonas nauphoetae TaxID=2049346 RepID=A0ABQ9XUC7_9EUKA|nr:putative Ypt/Rab-type GTPase YPT7 [Blattamonas nauphoetae]
MNAQEEPNIRLHSITLKVVFIGDMGVGKTSLLNQFVSHEFSEQYRATIGADFFSQELILDGVQVILQIWDTAGQERFKSLSTSYFHGADACGIVYDISNEDSINNISTWHSFFLSHFGTEQQLSLPFVYAGNKIDLPSSFHKPSSKRVHLIAQSLGSQYKCVETSAKTAAGVEELFVALAELALKKKLAETHVIQTPNLEIKISDDKTRQCSC